MRNIRPIVVLATAGALICAPIVSLPGTPIKPAAVSLATTTISKARAVQAKDGWVAHQITPKEHFELLGITWEDRHNAGVLEVRVQQANGKWQQWKKMGVEGTAPDVDSAESRGAEAGTAPLFTGLAQSVQIRVHKSRAKNLKTAKLVTIDPGRSKADEVAESTPISSASARGSRPRIITRKQWGARESYKRCRTGKTGAARAVFLHHTDGSNNYSRAGAYRQMRGIYAYHTRVRKYCDIAYNFVVDKYGRIFQGRGTLSGRNTEGAHTSGFNKNTVAVSLMGNYVNRRMSSAQMRSVARVMAWKLGSRYRHTNDRVTLVSSGKSGTNIRHRRGARVTRNKVSAHRDMGATACPGRAAYSQMSSLRKLVNRYSTGKVAPAPGRKPKPQPTKPRKPKPQPTKPGNSKNTTIWRAWQNTGGSRGPLGKPISREYRVGKGTAQNYQRGMIYKARGVEPKPVFGAIYQRYKALGGTRSKVGLPVTTEYKIRGRNAVGQKFSNKNSTFYWSRKTGARLVYGGIINKWRQADGPTGIYGLPTSDEKNVPGVWRARMNTFENGAVYWHPKYGSHGVSHTVYRKYMAMGGARKMGVPITDLRWAYGVGIQKFSKGGTLYASDKTGFHVLHGPIARKYQCMGEARSYLGKPRSSDTWTSYGRVARFERGEIRYYKRSRAVIVRRR